jgi:hypothetical protein
MRFPILCGPALLLWLAMASYIGAQEPRPGPPPRRTSR